MMVMMVMMMVLMGSHAADKSESSGVFLLGGGFFEEVLRRARGTVQTVHRGQRPKVDVATSRGVHELEERLCRPGIELLHKLAARVFRDCYLLYCPRELFLVDLMVKVSVVATPVVSHSGLGLFVLRLQNLDKLSNSFVVVGYREADLLVLVLRVGPRTNFVARGGADILRNPAEKWSRFVKVPKGTVFGSTWLWDFFVMLLSHPMRGGRDLALSALNWCFPMLSARNSALLRNWRSVGREALERS
eukprot:CAMPEP_0206514350 /NCGR_PEP_ID=MMETSP0324_2-20121206/62065_1 /ASSEMBLY_ACC=CAM_ASM_000836 /TAXON_ID=2866 /ORGANISM="Crypthecodinium cohnii, Strain Seligo" /LENGTH=245 /DNA_ID=CAMNT_0054006767 /DNA_START=71 /DNA_END=809 /DNA_ORIENTATION=-